MADWFSSVSDLSLTACRIPFHRFCQSIRLRWFQSCHDSGPHSRSGTDFLSGRILGPGSIGPIRCGPRDSCLLLFAAPATESDHTRASAERQLIFPAAYLPSNFSLISRFGPSGALAGSSGSFSITTALDGAVGRGLSVSPYGDCSGSSVETRRIRKLFCSSWAGLESPFALARRVWTGNGVIDRLVVILGINAVLPTRVGYVQYLDAGAPETIRPVQLSKNGGD